MYSVARYNAYVSATRFKDREEIISGKDEAIEYFVAEYRKMYEENYNDYIENFDDYMIVDKDEK